MSETPANPIPCAAYAEDVQEETQTPIPGTKHSSQVDSNKAKGDATSDSGYGSSSTRTTNGSKSASGSSSKLMNFMGRISGGTKKSKQPAADMYPPRLSSKTAGSQKKGGLRVNTTLEPKLETREDAARMKLSGEPVQRIPSNQSYETSPQKSRSARPSPPFAQAPPLRRPVLTSRAGLSRPVSYHGGVSGYGASYHNISFSPVPVYPQAIQPTPQYYQQPQITPISPTMVLPRHIAYPEQTVPAHYFPAGTSWDSEYQAPIMPPPLPHGGMSRRYSITGPPSHALVEYPTVPSRTVPRHPAIIYSTNVFSPAITDEDIHVDSNETFYRRKAAEEARQKMAPPQQRPIMRHASTTSAVRRTNRESREYVPRPETSYSRPESFSSTKEDNRVPLMNREKNIPMHVVESAPSPKQLRRTRPMSYHAGSDPERVAEQYQARQRGSIEPSVLEVHDVQRVKKSSKGHKSKASDAESRSSDSKRGSSAKKRIEPRQKPNGDGLSVEVVEGCTATLRRNSKGYVVRVSLNEESKERKARTVQQENTRDSRRYSASNRRESVPEANARSVDQRRPSSSHPSSRRIRHDTTDDEDAHKKLTDKYKMNDDTAVEDDEYPEMDLRKKRSEKHEKLTAQRLQRLRPSDESRQGPRSAQSNKSSKSGRSVPSSKASVRTERRS